MNVTFHTLTSLAIAAFLGSKLKGTDEPRSFVPSDVPALAIGFLGGVLVHGLLDYTPHSYPIESAVDVALGLALFFVILLLTSSRQWLLLCLCFLGSIFPDLVDLGPPIVNKYVGWSLPTVKVFPWHSWPYSGSIYDSSRGAESLLYHLLVVGTSLALLWAFRSEYSFERARAVLKSASSNGRQPTAQKTHGGGAAANR